MLLRVFAFLLSSSLIAAQYQGSVMAPVKIEVYSDFSCPHCRDFHRETIRPMVPEYVTTSKVYLIHRDYLLGKFPYSGRAALYANAAARVQKFEVVADALFDRQDVWTKDGNVDAVVASVLSKDEIVQVRKLVVDPATVSKINAEIASDMADGRNIQLTSTPTMTIASRKESPMKLDGGVSLPLLKSYLARIL